MTPFERAQGVHEQDSSSSPEYPRAYTSVDLLATPNFCNRTRKLRTQPCSLLARIQASADHRTPYPLVSTRQPQRMHRCPCSHLTARIALFIIAWLIASNRFVCLFDCIRHSSRLSFVYLPNARIRLLAPHFACDRIRPLLGFARLRQPTRGFKRFLARRLPAPVASRKRLFYFSLQQCPWNASRSPTDGVSGQGGTLL